MLLIPAIDLKDGHCVRLKQGDMDQSTVFSEDPAAMARKWVEAGARRLHLVDLNGAFAGKPQNHAAIKAILKEVGDDIPVQLGGGIRDLDTIERYIDDGLRYVIIGTAAVKNPGFLKDACSAFGGHIIVGLDAKDGKVATDGWSKLTGHEVIDLAKKFEDYGVEGVIYTDIGRDGMMGGVNIEATVKLAQAVKIPDEGIEGVSCGRPGSCCGTLERVADPRQFYWIKRANPNSAFADRPVWQQVQRGVQPVDEVVDAGDDTIQHRLDARDQPVRGLKGEVTDGARQTAPDCHGSVIGSLEDRCRPVAETDHTRDGAFKRRESGRLQPFPARSHVGKGGVERQADARPDFRGEIAQQTERFAHSADPGDE
eukprot:gene29538-39156_t